MKLISLGTSLRNPNRINNYLVTLSNFNGLTWDNTTQENFFRKLIENRLYGYDNNEFLRTLNQNSQNKIQNPNHVLTYQDITDILAQKNYRGGPSMRGRTAAKPLEKLGYANLYPTVSVNTAQVKSLLDALCHWREDQIYPFIAAIHFFNNLNMNYSQPIGLTEEEFSLFLTTLDNSNNLNQQCSNFFNYKLNNFNPQTLLYPFENSDNYLDYGDNLYRFYEASGCFYKQNGLIYLNYNNNNVNNILQYRY